LVICPVKIVYNYNVFGGGALNLAQSKTEDSEVLDGGTSQLSSQREYGEIKMYCTSDITMFVP